MPVIMIMGLALALQGSVQPNASPASAYTERAQKQFSFYPGGKIEIIAGLPGNFKIIGWKRASVLLETEKIFYQFSPEQAGKVSDHYPVRVKWGQSSATIRTSGPPGPAGGVELNATLYVPKDKTDLKISLYHGDLIIGAINGWVEATLEQGSLEAKSMEGYFSLLTKEGDVDVEMVGKRWNGLGFTAVTQRGSIVVRLPVEYSAALQFETRDGNITIDYPEQMVEGESVPLAVVTNKKVRSLTATVGEGGSPIRLHTRVGDIHLSTSPARDLALPRVEDTKPQVKENSAGRGRKNRRGSNRY